MEVHDFTGVGVAYPHIMDVVDRAIGCKTCQRHLDGLDAIGCGIAAQRQFRLQRLDMAVNLDVLAKFLANVTLQSMGDAVRLNECHLAVDFEVDADRSEEHTSELQSL